MSNHELIQTEFISDNTSRFKVCKKCGLWCASDYLVVPRALSLLRLKGYESLFHHPSAIDCDNYKKASSNALSKLSHLSHNWKKNTPSVIIECTICGLILSYSITGWSNHNVIESCDEVVMKKVLV